MPPRWLPVLPLAMAVAARAAGPAGGPLTPLPPEHWTRPLLTRLRFPATAAPATASPPVHPLETRLDAAVLLARWLQGGEPTPAARPQLLAAEFRGELDVLGLDRARVVRALEARAGAPVSPDTARGYSWRRTATRQLLDRSMAELEVLEERIRRLQAARDEESRWPSP